MTGESHATLKHQNNNKNKLIDTCARMLEFLFAKAFVRLRFLTTESNLTIPVGCYCDFSNKGCTGFSLQGAREKHPQTNSFHFHVSQQTGRNPMQYQFLWINGGVIMVKVWWSYKILNFNNSNSQVNLDNQLRWWGGCCSQAPGSLVEHIQKVRSRCSCLEIRKSSNHFSK